MSDLNERTAPARGLTVRETQLLKLAASGYSDKEMALILGISRETVTTYWKRLKAKFGATNRTSLVVSLIGRISVEQVPIVDDFLDQSEEEELDAKPEMAIEYQDLMEELSFGVAFENPDGFLVFSNKQFSNLMGLGDEEEFTKVRLAGLLGRVWNHFLSFESLLMGMRNLSETNKPGRLEGISLANGLVLDIDFTPVHRDEQLLGHLWHFRDVTTKRGDQSIIGLHGHRAIQAIDQHPEPRMTLTPDNRIEYMNPAAERKFGLRLNSAKGKHPSDLHAAFWTPWFRLLLDSSEVGGGRKRGEGKLEGVPGWYLVSATSWPEGTVLSFQDRTLEREQNRHLVEETQLAELIASLTPNLISASDSELEAAVRETLASFVTHLQGSWAAVYTVNSSLDSIKLVSSWSSSHLLEEPKSTVTLSDLAQVAEFDGPQTMEAGVFARGTTQSRILLPLRDKSSLVGYIELEASSRRLGSHLEKSQALSTLSSCFLGCLKRLKLVG